MNRKSFLILLALVALLGGAGLWLLKLSDGAWRGSGDKPGAKPFEKLAINDATRIRLVDGNGEVTLTREESGWTVKERGGYRANRQDVGDLLVKLPEVKIVQSESVGPTLLPRLNLATPGKDVKPETAATQLELADKGGQVLASALLGKKVIKIEDSPLPIKQETPVGRYVLLPGNSNVLVLSDALNSAEAKPARWVSKDFFKIERAKSIAVTAEGGGSWKVARAEEAGQWAFVGGGGQLDPRAPVAVANSLASMTFTDVAVETKPDQLAKPRTVVVETFDNLTYTIRLSPRAEGGDYLLAVSLAGEPPTSRPLEKDEKPADKERLDKQFADARLKLDERVKQEKALAGWTYVVPAKSVEMLLLERAKLVAAPAVPPKR